METNILITVEQVREVSTVMTASLGTAAFVGGLVALCFFVVAILIIDLVMRAVKKRFLQQECKDRVESDPEVRGLWDDAGELVGVVVAEPLQKQISEDLRRFLSDRTSLV